MVVPYNAPDASGISPANGNAPSLPLKLCSTVSVQSPSMVVGGVSSDFCYSNGVKFGLGSAERAKRATKGATGKRVAYRSLSAKSERPKPSESHWPRGLSPMSRLSS